MHTVTNRDVWGSIVKYFRVSLSEDSAEDVKVKTRTLLSIALARSELTTVAVSELWRSMKSLEPIIYAFNAPPFQALSPTFEHQREYSSQYSSDYWEMVHASDCLTENVKSRVLGYLSHVQYLHFPASPSSKECALWQTLLAFSWINPLCPKLRGITFTAGDNHPSMIYHLMPFLVPSLRSIRFDSATTSQDEAAVSMLLRFIKHREIQISDIAYTGYASRRIVKQVFQFPKLQSARVLWTNGYREPLEASDVQSFQSSTLLTQLYVDLDMFQATSEVGDWMETLQSLSTLSLQGTAPVVINLLQNRSFALVDSLTLFLCQSNRTSIVVPDICTIITAAFPILHTLHLENKESYNITNAAITLSDIHALCPRPMRCLVICGLQLSLTITNVMSLVKTWRSLERLSLVPHRQSGLSGFNRYCAYQLLSYISRHAPHVTYLNLPLDMSLFTACALTPRMTACPLQHLKLTQVQDLPSRLEGKLLLAQNLITLFPRLDVVKCDIDELQAIIKSFRTILSLPPRRGDNLY